MFSRKSASGYDRKAKINEAVGISYDEDKRTTPTMANELGIYVHKDQQLLNQLKCLKEGEEVPRELFEVIAQILAFSYILQGKTPQSYTRADGSRAININA